MTSNNPSAIWIKNPLAVFGENAEGGIVLKDQKILGEPGGTPLEFS